MTDKEKREAAEHDYSTGRLSYQKLADKYGVSINTIRSWKTRYGWKREDAPPKRMYDGKTTEERMLERQEAASDMGLPTWHSHPEPDLSQASEFDRRVIESIKNVSKASKYCYSVQDFEDAITEYIQYVVSVNSTKKIITGKYQDEHYAEIPSITGLCFWMGIPQRTIYTYFDRPEYTDLLNAFRDYCTLFDVTGMQQGLLDAVPSIFKCKTEHKMVEASAPTHVTNVAMISQSDIQAAIAAVQERKRLETNTVDGVYTEIHDE